MKAHSTAQSVESRWSPQQLDIFEWFRSAQGNLVVRARAGTGKTTTILEGISHAPERSILLCAFNKRIATELEERLRNPHAEAKTLHGIGFAAVRRYWEDVRVNARDRADALSRAVAGDQAPDPIVRILSKLHTKARELCPLATSEVLEDLALEHECDPDPSWRSDGYDLAWIVSKAAEAMELAASSKPATGIDFADMLFLPVRNGWLRPRWDLVVVDECQDMNATQLTIAQGVARGRIAVVGDDRQAIYGFRGADSSSLDRLKRELEATELGLSTTYRCGARIVAEAQRLVPDYRAAAGAHSGTICTMAIGKLAEVVAQGDFVLSRKNAPLVSCALRILRAGKRCKIEGRDIGKGLIALVKRTAKGPARTSMPKFLERLEHWEERELARATAQGKRGTSRLEQVQDQAETLRALAEGLSGVSELIARIESLFADRENDSMAHRVTCSSVHRAKGLEADRVFVLRDTLNPAVPCKCGHWPGAHRGGNCGECSCPGLAEDLDRRREEQNITYVAITRAKRELVWVVK